MWTAVTIVYHYSFALFVFLSCLICVGSFGILAYLAIFGCRRLTFLPSLVILIDAAIMCTFISSLIFLLRVDHITNTIYVWLYQTNYDYYFNCVFTLFFMIDSNLFWLVFSYSAPYSLFECQFETMNNDGTVNKLDKIQRSHLTMEYVCYFRSFIMRTPFLEIDQFTRCSFFHRAKKK